MTREEAIAHGKEQLEIFGGEHKEFIKLALEVLEQEPKTGHWIAVENEEMETVGYYCSECDLPMETEQRTNFCHNCGIKMVEPQKSEVNNG